MGKYVKYVGTSHWREITEKQWAELEPPVEQKTLRWDAANGWTISADRISDGAWPYIDADSELVVIDKDYRMATPTDDSAPADPKLYPPLATGQMAEQIDQAEVDAKQDHAARVEAINKADATQNDLPDQETASVEGPVDNKD